MKTAKITLSQYNDLTKNSVTNYPTHKHQYGFVDAIDSDDVAEYYCHPKEITSEIEYIIALETAEYSRYQVADATTKFLNMPVQMAANNLNSFTQKHIKIMNHINQWEKDN